MVLLLLLWLLLLLTLVPSGGGLTVDVLAQEANLPHFESVAQLKFSEEFAFDDDDDDEMAGDGDLDLDERIAIAKENTATLEALGAQRTTRCGEATRGGAAARPSGREYFEQNPEAALATYDEDIIGYSSEEDLESGTEMTSPDGHGDGSRRSSVSSWETSSEQGAPGDLDWVRAAAAAAAAACACFRCSRLAHCLCSDSLLACRWTILRRRRSRRRCVVWLRSAALRTASAS